MSGRAGWSCDECVMRVKGLSKDRLFVSDISTIYRQSLDIFHEIIHFYNIYHFNKGNHRNKRQGEVLLWQRWRRSVRVRFTFRSFCTFFARRVS